MQVVKRNNTREDVDLNKIVNSIKNSCPDLSDKVDSIKIATKTISGLFDGVTTKELDQLSIKIAVEFTSEDPVYSKVAARLLGNYIKKEVENQEIQSFSQSIKVGYENGIISEECYNFVMANSRKLNAAIIPTNDRLFEYFGLKTVYDRYLLKHPIERTVIEQPQYWLMRVACGLSEDVKEAIDFYKLISSLEYLTSTPTLFNSGTINSQMSSCYLLDSPRDSIEGIYDNYKDIALLSKFAGGIGVSYSRVRGSGSLIKGTNGKSNGIISFLHTLDASVASVNQCFIPGSLIKTKNGYTAIDEISIGDEIINTHGIDTVDEIMIGDYSGKIINISIGFNTISVTPEHPILVIKDSKIFSDEQIKEKLKVGLMIPEWISAEDVRVNDIIIDMANI